MTEQEAFERTLILHAEDKLAWGAYSDFLTERGDPRGEFMAIQLALEDENLDREQRTALKYREKVLQRKHHTEWLGKLAKFVTTSKPVKGEDEPMPVEARFQRGWVSELRINDLSVELALAIKNNPHLRFLQKLRIETQRYESPRNELDDEYGYPVTLETRNLDRHNPSMELLTQATWLESLRKLHLGSAYITGDARFEDDGDHGEFGTFAHKLIAQMPHVERLILMTGGVQLSEIVDLPMPNLRFFQADHLDDYPLDRLAQNPSITKLTHLLCRSRAVDYDFTDRIGPPATHIRLEHLRAICDAKWPDLKFLRLRITDFGDQGVFEILRSGILKRLKDLDLDYGCISDRGAEMLANSPDLKNLETLSLIGNAIHSPSSTTLQRAFPKVKLGDQHHDTPPFRRNAPPSYFFQGDSE
ncbi:MAG: TIGR02996 domain-containing protein [Fimbriiglobus sp.]